MKDNFGNLIFVGCDVAYCDITHRMTKGLVTFIDDDTIIVNNRYRLTAEQVVVLDEKYKVR